MEKFGVTMGSVPPDMQRVYEGLRSALDSWKVLADEESGELRVNLRWGEPAVIYALASPRSLRKAVLSLAHAIKGRAVCHYSSWDARVLEVRMVPGTARDSQMIAKMAFVLFLWTAGQHPGADIWDMMTPGHGAPNLPSSPVAKASSASSSGSAPTLPPSPSGHAGRITTLNPPPSIAPRRGG